MNKQVFLQKIKRNRYRESTAWLFAAVLIMMLVRNCFADAGISQSWTEDESGKCIAYVRGIPDVQEASAMIGTTPVGEVASSRLQDSQESHIMTYILVDNSASINNANKEKIRQVVTTLVQNHIPGELFQFATFDEEIHVANHFSDNYEAVLGSVNGIEYKDRQTYVMKAIYQIFGELQQDDGTHSYKRLLIFSDGGEGSSGGDFTLEEALNSIRNTPFPIYTMGCRWKGQPEWALDNFAALARQSGGAYFTLDDVAPENLSQIQDAMAQDYGAYRFDVPVPAASQDGSTKSLELQIKTSQGDVTVRTAAAMPQNSMAVVLPDIPGEVPAVEGVPTSTPTPKPSPSPTPTPLPVVTKAPEPEKSFLQKYWLLLLFILLILLAVIILIVVLGAKRKDKEKEKINNEVKSYINDHRSDSGEETVFFRDDMDEGTSTHTIMSGGFDTGGFEEDVTVKMFGAEREREIYIRFEDINRPGVYYNAPLKGGSLVVGRSSSKSDLVLREDATVSGRHFEITALDNRLYIEDLGSKNGTWVNRERLHGKHELHGGDTVRAGDTELIVDISS